MDGCEGVFLSVDVDVCDPGHAPGTGTPEPAGLTARQLLDSVRRIAYELPVLGMDVVEVSPPYDHAEITSFLCGRYLQKPSNSPFRTPPRKACHSSDVNFRTGPPEFLLLRTPISPPGRLATSTQLPLA